MQFDWNPDDRYLSNYGKGPIMARILDAADKIVTLEKWNPNVKCPRRNSFPLSIKFFMSPQCGWQKISPVPNGDRQ